MMWHEKHANRSIERGIEEPTHVSNHRPPKTTTSTSVNLVAAIQ
jgi:hypothetical protein